VTTRRPSGGGEAVQRRKGALGHLGPALVARANEMKLGIRPRFGNEPGDVSRTSEIETSMD
jgi:hypothetical protein